MNKEEKIAFLNNAYDTLLQQGKIHGKGEFAQFLGMSRSSVSMAMGGDERYLTDSMISKVKASMVIEGAAPGSSKNMIPMLPVSARGGSLADFSQAVREYECEWIISPVKGATLALTVTGDSMSPEYPSGTKILVRKVNEEAFIEWGKVYVLDTANGAIVKEVRQSSTEGRVWCYSLNPDPKFAPYEVETKYILGWYRVLLAMSLK